MRIAAWIVVGAGLACTGSRVPWAGAQDASGETAAGAVLSRLAFLGEPPGGRVLVEAALQRAVSTPLGAELAAEFLRENVPVGVRFEEMADSRLDKKGRIVGRPGVTHYEASGRVIGLNRLYLKADPDFTRKDFLRVFTHELFGHALGATQAERAGVADAFEIFEGNETNACLVEWIVSAEWGEPADDPGERLFVRDYGTYRRYFRFADNYNATSLAFDELRSPRSAWSGRREWIRRRLKFLDRFDRFTKASDGFVAHLLSKHRGRTFAGVRLEPNSFVWLRKEIAGRRKYSRRRRKNLNSAAEGIDRLLARLSDESVSRRARTLDQPAGREFFERFRSELEMRRARLMGLVPRGPEPKPEPSPPGQASWKDLKRIYAEDLRQDRDLLVLALEGDPSAASLADWALPRGEAERGPR